MAHDKIRPTDGHHVPYHVGWDLALAEAERNLQFYEAIEQEAIANVERIEDIKGNLERWLTAWGL